MLDLILNIAKSSVHFLYIPNTVNSPNSGHFETTAFVLY